MKILKPTYIITNCVFDLDKPLELDSKINKPVIKASTLRMIYGNELKDIAVISVNKWFKKEEQIKKLERRVEYWKRRAK